MQRGNNNLSKPIRNHLNTCSLRMTRRGRSIFGWIADGEDRHKLIVRHLREKLLELRRIEMPDSRRPQTQRFDFKHHVGRRNARIHIREVFLVKGTHKGALRLASHNEGNGRAEDEGRRL